VEKVGIDWTDGTSVRWKYLLSLSTSILSGQMRYTLFLDSLSTCTTPGFGFGIELELHQFVVVRIVCVFVEEGHSCRSGLGVSVEMGMKIVWIDDWSACRFGDVCLLERG